MSPARGMALKLFALFLFMVMASLIKASSSEVPSFQAVFFRSFFALPVIVIWLAARKELSTGLRTRSPAAHFWRGIIGTSAMACGFAALGLLPLPEVTAIGFASPLITVLLAAVLLGEKVRSFRLGAVGIGLFGVLVILWPRLSLSPDEMNEAAMLGVVLVLASAALRSLAQIHIRRMVQLEQTSAVVFYFSLTATLLSLFTIPFGWVMPSGPVLFMLICAGLIGGVGQIFLTSSYRFAEASVLAPFEYASMLYALVFGYVLFGEVPTGIMMIGVFIVTLAGALIIWRERQLGLARGKARRTMTPQG
ncbi:DMT family transporter [Primorskyibacter sedentarius]|uniref:DMT family transporter n=1 Tax=Primorskyibacter sedentarius TaxID=745311 RepID=UPI003EBC9EDE